MSQQDRPPIAINEEWQQSGGNRSSEDLGLADLADQEAATPRIRRGPRRGGHRTGRLERPDGELLDSSSGQSSSNPRPRLATPLDMIRGSLAVLHTESAHVNGILALRAENERLRRGN